MNTIQMVDLGEAPQCHIMTIADLAPTVRDISHLPEFSFSPRAVRNSGPTRPNAVHPVAPIGPMVPPSISNPRPKGEVTPIDDREKAWRNLEPLSVKHAPIKRDGFVAPLGALDGIEHFIARVEAIKRLTDQQARDEQTARVLVEQDMEMSTILEEFRANGFSAVSLSSSSLDDDDGELDAANIAESHLKITPFAYGIKGYTEPDEYGTRRPIYRSAPEAAPLLRRIEHERETAKHGPSMRVRIVHRDDLPGEMGATTEPWMYKAMGPDMLRTLSLKVLRSIGKDTFDDLAERRRRANYYGAVGSLTYGVKTGFTPPPQSMDDLGIEDMEKKDEFKQGPQELGLHGGPEVKRVRSRGKWRGHREGHFEAQWAAEPSEQMLWPDQEAV